MKRSVQVTLLLAALGGLGFGGWRVFFPSPEKIIRQRLTEMASLASFAPNEGALAKALNAQKLANFCAPDVELMVTVPGYAQTINGRDELLKAAMMARSTMNSLQLEFPDISVNVAADKQTAVAQVTARAKIGADKDFDVREFKCRLQRIDGTWLLSRVESARTLRD